MTGPSSELDSSCVWIGAFKRRWCRARLRKPSVSSHFTCKRSAVLVFLSLLISGCHARQTDSGPSIEFSKIPPAAQGGRERVDTIAGRVIGARPGQRIVVYARSGPWWVQPSPEQPFITIQADSKWSTTTHLGYEYAALLVEPAYHPPPTMDVAPTQGGSVVALNIVKGVGSLPPNPTKPLDFSGYDWKVRTVSADRGGVNNLYDGSSSSCCISSPVIRIRSKNEPRLSLRNSNTFHDRLFEMHRLLKWVSARI
jgi:hypothetical protein